MENAEYTVNPLSPRQRRRLRDLDEILLVAARCFARGGYRRTSMQTVATQAGFSVGKLYSFFSGKELLLARLQEVYRNGLLTALQEGDDPGAHPIERIRARLLATFDFFNRHPDLARVGLLERPEEDKSVSRPFREGLVRQLRAILDEAVRSRAIAPVNTLHLALMIQGACDNLTLELGKRDVPAPFSPIPELVMSMMIQPLVRRQVEQESRFEGRSGI